jgi:hypothetical protein
MKCLICPLKYKEGHLMYKEHIHAIRKITVILDIQITGHTCSMVSETVDIMKTGRKGKHLNTLE